MADVCKLGGDFFSWSSAVECKDFLEKKTGKPHYIAYGTGWTFDSPRNAVVFVYERPAVDKCKIGEDVILFSERDTDKDAEQCAQTLRNLTGQEYYASLAQQTSWFMPDVYAVLKK